MVIEEKKMKSKLGIIVTLLLALMLITYSGYLSAQPDISQSWKGSVSSRTWVIFEFMEEPPPMDHFVIGDSFRIQEVHNRMQFVPLGLLRKRWNRSEGSIIPLSRKGPNKQKLCGDFALDNHPGNSPRQHFIVVDADPDDTNRIFVTITDVEDFKCTNLNHGGKVHAVN